MARKKSSRGWGGGEVLTRGAGKAIRWREPFLDSGAIKYRRRYLSLGTVTQREAERRLAEKLIEAGSIRTQKPNVTFAEHGQRWIVKTLPTYKFSVREDYRWIIEKILIPRFGEMLVSATPEASRFLITMQSVQEFIGEMTERYAPHTVHHRHETLRAVLKDAVQWYRVLESNPAEGVRLPELVAKRKKWAMSPMQVMQLMQWLSGRPRARAAFWLLIATGIRRGEYLALRWKHFDEEKSEINVCEAYYRGHLGTPKTASSVRRVPLNAFGLQLLREWKAKSIRTQPGDLIFGTRNGKPDRPENLLRRHVHKGCDELGIPRPTFLTFRRTFSTMISGGGLAPKDVAALMGHSEPEMQFVYIQTASLAQRAAVDGIGTQLGH